MKIYVHFTMVVCQSGVTGVALNLVSARLYVHFTVVFCQFCVAGAVNWSRSRCAENMARLRPVTAGFNF